MVINSGGGCDSGGLLVDRSFITTVQQHVRRLCGELLPDAVALVDAFGIPDTCLAAPIGLGRLAP